MFSRDARTVLFIQAGMSFSLGVSTVFASMYLYRYLDGLVPLAVYNLFQFALVPAGFYLAAAVGRRTGKAPVLVASFALFAVFYALLLALGEESRRWLYWLGALNGLANGAFWYPFNVAIARASSGADQGRFFGVSGALSSGAGALAPLASTAALMLAPRVEVGYGAIFAAIALLSVAMALAALGLRLPSSGGPVRVLPAMLPRGDPGWEFVLLSNLVYGVRDGANWSIASILALRAAGSDEAAGRLNVLFALAGIAANWAGGRRLTDRRGSAFWLWGSLLALAASVGLALARTPAAAAVSGSAFRVGEALVLLPFYATYFGLLDRYIEAEGDIAGRSVAMEIAVNAGRAAGVGLFCLGSMVTPRYAEIFYPLVTLAMPGSWLVYRRYRRLRSAAPAAAGRATGG